MSRFKDNVAARTMAVYREPGFVKWTRRKLHAYLNIDTCVPRRPCWAGGDHPALVEPALTRFVKSYTRFLQGPDRLYYLQRRRMDR